MSLSEGCAMRLPAPTNCAAGCEPRGRDRGTPPSPSMKPSPFASLDCGVMDQSPIARTVDCAGAFGVASNTDASVAREIVRSRTKRRYAGVALLTQTTRMGTGPLARYVARGSAFGIGCRESTGSSRCLAAACKTMMRDSRRAN